MEAYQILYAESFKNSLLTQISNWENDLQLSEATIKRFVETIYRSLELLKTFPEMHEDVAMLYGFTQPTYRILIGKSLAIFYRIDQETKTVLIGNIFSQKQMKLTF